MWVWEVVDEVETTTLLLSNLWEITSMLCLGLLCYARRRGLGECIHDRCEIVN